MNDKTGVSAELLAAIEAADIPEETASGATLALQHRRRDYGMAALQGLLSSPNPAASPDDCVKLAWLYADLMMKAEGDLR